MKKAIALFFLTSYLFSTTELSQLLKLPSFVSHYKEHKELNHNLTLWQFLCIHYAQGDVKDADYEEDMQLPFKTHANCTAQMNVAVPPAFLEIHDKHTQYHIRKNTHIVFADRVTSSYHSSIWQPPKSC